MGRIEEDLFIAGALSCSKFTPPSSCIGNAAVQTPAAGAGLAAEKLEHQPRRIYAQGSGTTAAAATQVLHVVYGQTGTIVSFKAGAVVPNVGAATCTVDLKKNGTSVLTAAISLTSANGARALVAASIATAGLVAGDVLEVVVTATAGGGTLAQGLFASLVVNEDGQ